MNEYGRQSEAETKIRPEYPIIFFDGVCNICAGWSKFVLRNDRNGIFRLAPLQGQTAAGWLDSVDIKSLNSVLLVDEKGIHRDSEAVVSILWKLGHLWKIVAALLWLIPSPIRNWGYRVIARYRYRIFGKKVTAYLPSADECSRFLP